MPKHVVRDAMGLVAQYTADARHLGPCDGRMPRLELIAKMAVWFENDLISRSTSQRLRRLPA
jgi:hypothetical protein